MSLRVELGSVSEIPPGEGRNFEVAGRKLAVFRARTGQVFATQAVCPHRGGPLADGLVGDRALVCPLHEWRFDLATGKTQNGACDIQVYPTAVATDGRITVELPGPPET
jgi:nitrite reductase (NADH) small subunit